MLFGILTIPLFIYPAFFRKLMLPIRVHSMYDPILFEARACLLEPEGISIFRTLLSEIEAPVIIAMRASLPVSSPTGRI